MKNRRTSLRDYRGARLVEKRLAAGLTREQLAAKARVSTLTLKNWERGRTKPQPDKVRAVREVLAEVAPTSGIDADVLRTDVENCRKAMQELDSMIEVLTGQHRTVIGYMVRIAAHADPRAKELWDKHGPDFLDGEAAREELKRHA